MKIAAVRSIGIWFWCALLCIEGALGQQFIGFPLRQDSGSTAAFVLTYQRFGPPAPKCLTICPTVVTPTCAFNGFCYKSFRNPCELSNAICLGQGNFRLMPVVECSRVGVRLCP